MAVDPAALFYPTADEIQDLHDTIIASTGGLAGVRVDIHGVVGRIETNLTYREFGSIAEVAALYADTIVNGHYFQDGNKNPDAKKIADEALAIWPQVDTFG